MADGGGAGRQDSSPGPDAAEWSPPRGLALTALFALCLGVMLALFPPGTLLYDTDSYYHLAVAREFAREGIPEDLPWARYSVLAEGFGDKEVLFHLLLAPFAALPDPVAGGRIALSLLVAASLTLVGGLAWRAAGVWGLALPVALLGGAYPFAWRVVRLRPELLSLVLLLLVVWAIGARRFRWLVPLAALYALSYTAFHALLALCLLELAFTGVIRRRWEWRVAVYPFVGTLLGLVVHPHFPHNLAVWKVVAVDVFFGARGAETGTEILPVTTDVALLANLGLWLTLAVLWQAGRREATPADGDLADAFGVGAAAFGGLALLMSRFALYALPLLGLWVLFELRRRGTKPGAWVEVPGGIRLPTALALVAALLLPVPWTAREVARLRSRTSPGPDDLRVRDLQGVAAALPSGARVAAPWSEAQLYVFWRPEAFYLNVLDPVLMSLPHPDPYAAQLRLFAGREPDPPLAVAAELDSDFVAFSGVERGGLAVRLASDPRVVLRHRGLHQVWQVREEGNAPFLLDWREVPAGAALPVAPGRATTEWRPWPRHPTARGRAVEGFVDARRLGAATGCRAFVTDVEDGDRGPWEVAGWGRTTLWRDGELLVSTGGAEAVLGEGVVLPGPLGPARVTVLTCPAPADDPASPLGFYLLRRGSG